MVPQIVGRSSTELANTNGRLAAADTAGRSLAGPPLGGVLFAVAPWAPFAVDAASFVVSGATLVGVPKRAAPVSERKPLWREVHEGFAYLLRDRVLVVLAAAMSVYNLAYNVAFGIFVLYAQDVLGLGSAGFGLLLTAGSIGAILMGWRAKSVVRRIGVRGSALASGLAQAVGWAALAVSGSTVVAVVVLALLGAASTLITVAVVTARQQQVPDHLLGRVVSAFRLFGNGAAPLGAAVGGLLASSLGVVAPLWIAAAAALVVLAVLQLGLNSSTAT
jgi:predicted MFS family arabinose efflux permease